MDAADIEQGVVIGGGTMGRGIAQVLAMCGVEATLVDLDEGVTSFSEIENGPARGIVYAVHGDEQRQGLWFAPR